MQVIYLKRLILVFLPLISTSCIPQVSKTLTMSEQLPDASPTVNTNLVHSMSCKFNSPTSNLAGDYCWHIVDIGKHVLREIQSLCEEQKGKFVIDSNCETQKETPQCNFNNTDIKMAGFYTGNGWTINTIKQHCAGSLIAEVLPEKVNSSCNLASNTMNICIDYVNATPDGTEWVKQDCAGDWQANSLCSVPTETLGCKIEQRELGITQTIWYLGKNNIKDLCAPDQIVTK